MFSDDEYEVMEEALYHWKRYLGQGGELTQVLERVINSAISKIEDALE